MSYFDISIFDFKTFFGILILKELRIRARSES